VQLIPRFLPAWISFLKFICATQPANLISFTKERCKEDNNTIIIGIAHILSSQETHSVPDHFRQSDVMKEICVAFDSWRAEDITSEINRESAIWTYCLWKMGRLSDCVTVLGNCDAELSFSHFPWNEASESERLRLKTDMFISKFFCAAQQNLSHATLITIASVASVIFIAVCGVLLWAIVDQVTRLSTLWRYVVLITVIILFGLIVALRASKATESLSTGSAEERAIERELNRMVIRDAFAKGAEASRARAADSVTLSQDVRDVDEENPRVAIGDVAVAC
jgi:hypothetical protein